MPFHRRPNNGNNVAIDADGFITIGTSLPFKDIEETQPDGTIRITHLVKHPTEGEIAVAFTDIQP